MRVRHRQRPLRLQDRYYNTSVCIPRRSCSGSTARAWYSRRRTGCRHTSSWFAHNLPPFWRKNNCGCKSLSSQAPHYAHEDAEYLPRPGMRVEGYRVHVCIAWAVIWPFTRDGFRSRNALACQPWPQQMCSVGAHWLRELGVGSPQELLCRLRRACPPAGARMYS